MSLYPYMGTPQSVQGGLLGSPSYPMGAAQSYAYPLTSGLLGAISNAGGMHPFVQQATGLNPSVAAQQAQMSQTPQDYTQVALGLAGNPHAGPYSTAGNTVQPGPATNSTAGSTSGSSTGSQVLGGLLGALSKNPSLVRSAGNAISGLLGGSLGAYGSGAAANAAVASQLGNSAASDGTAQSVQNSNDAALNGSDAGANGASAGLLSMDNLGSGMAANSAVTGELGGAGAQTAGESAAIQAANDAALSGSGAGLLGSGLGAYGSGAAADAAIASQLGNVVNDGTAASVAAANDAALNATDGGAAGAGAGASGALGSAAQALGALGAGYSLYNTVKNYQSGATGSDALNGAETGASIGTAIMPGVGTVVGGLLGAAGGALSSAFGPGQEDPENAAWNQYAAQYNANPNIASTLTPDQAYQNLAGVMDAKSNSPGHSQPIEQVFGRMGEQNLMDQMTSYINQQEQAGKIKPGESVQDQWNQVINPWLQSKGAGINMNQNTAQGAPEGAALTNDLQTLVGQWENGLITPQNSVAGGGMVIGGLPGLYSGMTPQQLSALQQRINANTAHQQLIHSIGSTKKFNG